MLILGGSDTTSINLTWLLSLLLNNQHALQHAQEELDIKVGRERWVEEHDINYLVYLQAIIKESLALIPTSPSMSPTWGNGRLSCIWLLLSKVYSFVCKCVKVASRPKSLGEPWRVFTKEVPHKPFKCRCFRSTFWVHTIWFWETILPCFKICLLSFTLDTSSLASGI